MSGYLIGLFWTNVDENFDFIYRYENVKNETLNTSKLTNEVVDKLINKQLSIEIHNIRIDNLNINLSKLNIESILINKCNIKSVKILSEMKGLKKITIVDSEIKDFDIKNESVNYLSIYNSNIEFSQISKLTELTELYYRSCKQYNPFENCNLSILNNLKNLFILNLNDNNINSIDDLPFFENLISLDIGLNNIQNINSLEKYKKLIYIYLNSNQITDIDSLKNNSIKYLNVSNNKISNIMIIESFKELESLNIKNNCIKVLPNLLNLKNLDYECLKLDWNNIMDVNGMKGFQLLKNMINSLSNK
jgi:Leucine-rich repeat (LRR) protein